MQIQRTDEPDMPYATGMLAPIARIMSHIGYSMRIVEKATDENWGEGPKGEIQSEMRECLAHIGERTADTSPYISDETAEATAQFHTALREFYNAFANDDRDVTAANLSNLAHMGSHAMAMLEKGLIGGTPQAGIML